MEPILVKNPKTGQYLNVAPLFAMIEEFDVPFEKSLEMALRVINLATHEDYAAAKSTNFDLYRMKDMFDAMFITK